LSNPYLPKWEHIPDGEPRVFGDRVYVYGSHDNAASGSFCDYKLKVWSARLDHLDDWVCHGDAFHTRCDRDHQSCVPWTDNYLYAPDVVEKDGNYYLYAYILCSKGCVAVSKRPEGPFSLISDYKYKTPQNDPDKCFDGGIFTDPGVLVDDDGRVYIYCGFQRSFGAELDAENMTEVVEGSFVPNIIPREEPFAYFEACSPRRVGDTYYLVYSPQKGSRLCYAKSKAPLGPYEYGGIIVDNGRDYPGGNNHGSICDINGQWYIFYHRMTNGTVFSRRACVERIKILPDGSIPQVEMTSLGFEESLSPYNIIPADIACVLGGGCLITELDVFTRVITNITDGCIIGYKYFDFGNDYSSRTMEFHASVLAAGCNADIHVMSDGEDGDELGICHVAPSGGACSAVVRNITGRHAIFLVIKDCISDGWGKDMFRGRRLFDLVSFAFVK